MHFFYVFAQARFTKLVIISQLPIENLEISPIGT